MTFGRYYLVEELRAMKADGLKQYFAQVGGIARVGWGRCYEFVVFV